jgi:hypothetical protein
MLQKTKNKETMSILKRLKQKGPPTATGSMDTEMDMTLEPEGELMKEPELGMPDASGIVTDLSMPGSLPIGAPRPIKKKKQETPRSR